MSSNPIDAVITWVDGDEPSFVAQKMACSDWQAPPPVEKWRLQSTYEGVGESRENPVRSSHRSNRFRNTDELRYLLRSLEKFAPWFRRIYLVTNGQVPSWLKSDGSRLRLVPHSEIFPTPDALPTFNSHAIEFCLSRIPGLSNEFVYFNDDTFLAQSTTVEDFKTAQGKYRMFVEPGKTLPVKMSDRSLIAHVWAINHNMLIDRFGGKKARFMFAHTPQMYNRQHLDAMQLVWKDEIESTINNRFRTPFDAQQRVLFMHYAVEGGIDALMKAEDPTPLGVMTSILPNEYSFIRFGEERHDFMEAVRRAILQRPRFICVNDEIDTGDDAGDQAFKNVLQALLIELFPEKSEFELPDAAQEIEVPDIEGQDGFSELHLLSVRSLDKNGVLNISLRTVDHTRDLSSDDLPILLPPNATLIIHGEGHDAIREEAHGQDIAITTRAVRSSRRIRPERGQTKTADIVLSANLSERNEIEVADLIASAREKLHAASRLEHMLNSVPETASNPVGITMHNAIMAVRCGTVTSDHIDQLRFAGLAGVDPVLINRNIVLAGLQTRNRAVLDTGLARLVALEEPGEAAIEDIASHLRYANRTAEIDAITASNVPWTDSGPEVARIAAYHRLWSAAKRGVVLDDFDILLDGEDLDAKAVRLWGDIVLQAEASGLASGAVRTIELKAAKEPMDVELAIARLRVTAACRKDGPIKNHPEIRSAIRQLLNWPVDADRLTGLAREILRRGDLELAGSFLDALETRYATHPEVRTLRGLWRVERSMSGIDTLTAAELEEIRDGDPMAYRFWTFYDRLQIEIARDGDIASALDDTLRFADAWDHVQVLVLALRQRGSVDRADRLEQALESHGAVDVSFIQYQAEKLALHGTDTDKLNALVDRASALGAPASWKGIVQAKHRVRLGASTPVLKALPQPKRNIVLLDDNDMRGTQLRSQIYDGIMKAVVDPDLWSRADSDRKDFSVSLKLGTPANALLTFDLADRRAFDQTGQDKEPLVHGFDWVLVPGEWFRSYLLKSDTVDIAPEKIVVVGSPRIDYLRSRAREVDVDTKGRKKVLFAPLHDHWNDKDGSSMSCRAEMEQHLEEISNLYDLTVEVDPRNIIQEKEPVTQSLLEASVVITDYTSLIYEAWALGKPVIFPSWITSEKIMRKAPHSAEAQIYREKIGLHAESFQDMLAMLDAENSPGRDVEDFMQRYVMNFKSGNAGARIAYFLESIADPGKRELFEHEFEEARALVEDGRFSDAEKILRKHAVWNKNNPDLFVALADALCGQSRHAEAAEELRAIRELGVTSSRLSERLGDIEMQLGDHRKAAEYYAATARDDQQLPADLLLKLAHAQEMAGDHTAALATYNRMAVLETTF